VNSLFIYNFRLFSSFGINENSFG